ncbi:MAG: UDP-N-acetylmuramoyl-L-alanine--D-glutamate ligase [Planctomycetota bacterium]|jgi:UDP-N-acetylmuramoylalanine--D-glutamate ligase
MTTAEVRNRSVLVMGLGRFGGGIGACRWLCAQGAEVTATDLADADALADSVAQLSDCDITFHLGGHDERDLETADLVVVSPAVDRRRSEFFSQIRQRRIPCTTEINLFLERCRGRVIAVTGTAGKSTTCALLHAVLEPPAVGERGVWFGGNVGRSLLADLPRIRPDDFVIVELSSFQLETMTKIEMSPHVAAITNVWPNHLDRHGDFESYLDAKLSLFRLQQAGCAAVVGPGDAALREVVAEIASRTGTELVVPPEPAEPYELRIPGRHNRVNAACAGTVAALLGVEESAARARMAAFGGLPHRLEHVGRLAGIDYYNDSKTTTARGVATALEAFDRPAIVIAGGQDRGDDLGPLVDAVTRRARAVVCIGQCARRLAEAVTAARRSPNLPTVDTAADLAEAVPLARRQAAPGDVILLSPGAPSYDQFANYEQRGQEFSRLVNSLNDRQ